MTALLSALGLVFVAELGDKSMLLALLLTPRFGAWRVLAAIAIEAAVLMALAVVVGGAVDTVLPDRALALGSGFVFIGFGIWALRSDDDAKTISTQDGRSGLVLIGTLAFALILSELGDKTQIAAVSLSGMNPDARLGVWVGATAGMIGADAVAVAAGGPLMRVVPRRALAVAAGALFIAFGAVAIVFAFL